MQSASCKFAASCMAAAQYSTHNGIAQTGSSTSNNLAKERYDIPWTAARSPMQTKASVQADHPSLMLLEHLTDLQITPSSAFLV